MMTEGKASDRSSEWFVPKFGPPKFRIMAGLLFLPYTAMVLSFTAIGSMLARHIYWDRVLSIMLIYFLGLGIAAHALDAVGSKERKPWGHVFTRPQLWSMAVASLVVAYAIAVYYLLRYVPWLSIVAVLEGFFVFAYNLEWFHGRFHTDGWFAFSWGFLPALAGHVMQTNRISPTAMVLALSMGLLSIVEIKASRPYKAFKGRLHPLGEEEKRLMEGYEAILKSISLGVVLLAVGLVVWRIFD
jgi:xanthine/uracil permease